MILLAPQVDPSLPPQEYQSALRGWKFYTTPKEERSFLSATHLIEHDSAPEETDEHGNIIRSKDVPTLQQRMASVGGFDFVPLGFHHDFLPLPTGHVIALVYVQKSFIDLPAYLGTLVVTGDRSWI